MFHKKNCLKNSEKWFSFTDKAVFVLEIFKFLYLPFSFFFPLSAIAEFLKKILQLKESNFTFVFEPTLFLEYYDEKQKGSGTITSLFSGF